MPTGSALLKSLLTIAVVFSCLAIWFPPDASAQQATAKIVGMVTDQQGAVVPGVKITVTNTATNVATQATSDKGGFYQVLDLPIGKYRIAARHEGFRAVEVITSPLEINQSFRADLKLEVGAATEQVLVESQAAGVETVNPTLGESVTSRPIVNLPLNGRNVLSLALLQPGVTEDNPDDTSASQGFNIGGGRTDSVTYLLDGGVNNELLGNGVVLNPNPDSIAEFRILTSNYGAEYGRNGAGIISVVTKSGTNDFHGSAFDFVRNTDFDADPYFNKEAGLPRNNLKRNQFGGTFGGPIVKDRLFFFTSYQGQRQTQTDVLEEQQIFTTAELNGDFSHALAYQAIPYDSFGNQEPAYQCTNPAGCVDPNVASFLATNTYFQSNPTLAAQGIIDPTKFDPAAQAYIATGAIPSNTTGEIFPAAGSTDNNNEFDLKVDFNIDSKDKLTGTVGGIKRNLGEPFGRSGGYSANVPGFPATDTVNNYFLNLAYTRTFSPTMLNELRGTAQRHNTLSDKPVKTLPALSDFGIASDLSNGPPLISFDNGLTVGQDQSGPAKEIGNTFGVADTFTWVKGRNTWKFGAGFSAYQQNTIYAFFTDSDFSYYGYAAGGVGTGNSFADFLVGAPNDLFEGPNAVSNFRSKATYVFGQDEWRVRPNLTLTLGLRYEYSTPKIDTQGRTFSIIPGDQSTRFPYAPLGLVFPGDAGAPHGANFPDKTNFAPRIGFAYSPSGKTSIRGGFGLFYDILKGEDNLQFNGAPPFYSEPYVTYACVPTGPTALGGSSGACPVDPVANPAYTSSGFPYYSAPWATSTTPLPANPFPSTPPNPATAFNTTGNTPFLPFGGGGIYFVNPHLHTPYTYQYNLSVQHELGKGLIAEVSYVGSSSKGLTSLEDINPFDLSTLSSANPARLLNEQATIGTNFGSYCGFPSGASDCPFSSAAEFSNLSFANFNSLEASLTKQNGENRILGNTYFTLAYTYGHSLDNSSGFRNRDSQVPYYNHNIFYGSSDFDIKERITFSGGWDLPFDRAFASAPKRLVKGWSLYPILSWRTGFPLSISSGMPANPGDPGPSGAGDGFLALADFAPGFSHVTTMNPRKNGNYYFNPAAFVPVQDVYNPSDPYGDTGRDFFRGPGRTNLDMTVAKSTAITERVNVEIRLDAFNVFNHAEFANPDTNIDDQTFGQITTTQFGSGVINPPLQSQRILQLAGRLTF